MTDQQINAAIAEACGWKEVRVNGSAGVYKGFDNGAELRPDIPDYCTDLNAMHEAEKVLVPKDEGRYFLTLKQMVGDLIWYRDTCRNYRATARERAEAFLLTLGKWSATDKESLTVGAITEDSSAVQGVGWPPFGTRISRMNADGKWEEV